MSKAHVPKNLLVEIKHNFRTNGHSELYEELRQLMTIDDD